MRSRQRVGAPRLLAYRALCGALALIALFVIPTWPVHLISNADTALISVASLAAIWAVVATATGMFANLTGLPTLAQAGLWGIGAYSAGVAINHLHVGFWPSLVFAAIVPALIAIPTALVSLRTSGMAFLVVTIAFTEFVVLVITNLAITNGPAGIGSNGSTGSIGPLHFDSLRGQYYLYLAFLVAALVIYWLVTRSAFGARIRAVRDDERLARSLGISPLRERLLLFVLSAAVAGVAGDLLLFQQQIVTPDLFNSLQFIAIYLAIVLGGTYLVIGPAVGAWIVQFLPLWIGSSDPNVSMLIYGALLVVAMLLVPRGIIGAIADWAHRPSAPHGPDGLADTPTPEICSTNGVGSAPRPARRCPDLTDAPILIDARGVTRWFGANRALDGVDLQVRAGEIRGVIGPNGSGKTTLLNCLSGFLPLTHGSVRYQGRELSGLRPEVIARLGLIRSFQEARGFRSFTVKQSCDLVARLASPRSVVNDRMPSDPREILDSCGLSHLTNAAVQELSYGQLRLFGVALVLCRRPSLLLLDEAVAGLGARDVASLNRIIRAANAAGITIIAVDHDMSFLLPLTDQVTVLDGGKKLTEGPPDSVARSEQVISAYLGERFAQREFHNEPEGAGA